MSRSGGKIRLVDDLAADDSKCACEGQSVGIVAGFVSGLTHQSSDRPGHAQASRALRSPFGLAWRLQRGALLGFGLIMGGLIGQVKNSTGTARDWYVQLAGSDQILDAYRASIMQMAGAAAAIYAVQVLLRMRAEEADGPLEPILATAVSRLRWVASYAVTVLLGATTLVLLSAIGTGLAAGVVLGDTAGQMGNLIAAGLVQLPGFS